MFNGLGFHGFTNSMGLITSTISMGSMGHIANCKRLPEGNPLIASLLLGGPPLRILENLLDANEAWRAQGGDGAPLRSRSVVELCE